MNLYVMTPHDGIVCGPFNEEKIIEYARQERISAEWIAAPEGENEWRPLGSILSLPKFYEIHTPDGSKRLTREEIERGYLLGTLAPTCFYEHDGAPHYIDTLVSDKARAERARIANPPAAAAPPARPGRNPGPPNGDEWEKSECSRGIYIGLALSSADSASTHFTQNGWKGCAFPPLYFHRCLPRRSRCDRIRIFPHSRQLFHHHLRDLHGEIRWRRLPFAMNASQIFLSGLRSPVSGLVRRG